MLEEEEVREREKVRTPEDGGRANVLRQCVEHEGGDDCACLARCGGHAVCGGTEAGGEDFGGVALQRYKSCQYLQPSGRQVGSTHVGRTRGMMFNVR